MVEFLESEWFEIEDLRYPHGQKEMGKKWIRENDQIAKDLELIYVVGRKGASS